jgi:hypothetical protein
MLNVVPHLRGLAHLPSVRPAETCSCMCVLADGAGWAQRMCVCTSCLAPGFWTFRCCHFGCRGGCTFLYVCLYAWKEGRKVYCMQRRKHQGSTAVGACVHLGCE